MRIFDTCFQFSTVVIYSCLFSPSQISSTVFGGRFFLVFSSDVHFLCLAFVLHTLIRLFCFSFCFLLFPSLYFEVIYYQSYYCSLRCLLMIVASDWDLGWCLPDTRPLVQGTRIKANTQCKRSKEILFKVKCWCRSERNTSCESHEWRGFFFTGFKGRISLVNRGFSLGYSLFWLTGLGKVGLCSYISSHNASNFNHMPV